MSVFKKVIGQDQNEPVRPAVPLPESRQPEPLAPPSYGAGSHAAPAPARSAPAATRNVLSTDVEIKGTVKFTDDLVVDGKIEGEIISNGNLTVGENARLKAEIKTGTVVIYGKVHGNITAADRIELKASSEVVGDVKAKTLAIEAGAIFVGKSTVGTPAEVPASTPSQPAAAKPAAAPAQSAPAAAAKPAAAASGSQQGTLLGKDS